MLSALEKDQDVCFLTTYALRSEPNNIKCAFCIGLSIISAVALIQIMNIDKAC